MSAPQLFVISFMAFGLGVELVKDGQLKTGKHSFGLQLFSCLITAGLLWWGGFWK